MIIPSNIVIIVAVYVYVTGASERAEQIYISPINNNNICARYGSF